MKPIRVRVPDHSDGSGTPGALISQLASRGALYGARSLDPGSVVVEFPFGAAWRDATGFQRFVLVRAEGGAVRHVLLEGAHDD